MNIALLTQCVWVPITLYGWYFPHFTKNKIYTNLLGANMVQRSANEEEIKGKHSKYRTFIAVYMGL